MAASAPLSAGPSVRVLTVRTSGGTSGSAASGKQQPGRERGYECHRDDEGDRHHRHEQRARSLATELHRQRALAGPAVGVDVADVVHHEDRRREQSHGHPQSHGLPAQVLRLDEVRARHGHDAEEQEHEQLAEALVPVGARAAGVEHAGEDRRRAHHQQLPAGDGREVEAGRHRHAERHVGAHEHPPRRHQAAGRDPHGAEPVLGVGAAPGVRVVVREVRADLDEHAAEQRGHERAARGRCPRSRPAPFPPARGDRGGQRPRPRREQPEAQVAQGRFGNFPKSGRRFSR